MQDWELPVSEIRWYTYRLINVYGYDRVVASRNDALEGPLDEGGMVYLACEGKVLRDHVAINNRIKAWRDNVVAVPSDTPSMHPFDLHRRLLSPFSDGPDTPSEAPDYKLIQKALAREYDRWFLLTLLGKFRYDDRKASEGRNILRNLKHHNSSTEPDDWEDFWHSKSDKKTQNHRASCDEPKNPIYNNTASVGPSGLTTTMPRQSYPPPQPHHQLQAHPQVSPTSQPPALSSSAAPRHPFNGLALVTLYEQERKQARDAKQ